MMDAGPTTTAHEGSPEELIVVQTLKTVSGTRTMALGPAISKIYLPCANFETNATIAATDPPRRIS
jgi:hypothetical protein